jgi:3-hydroxyacyl-[acyl-carrier-protein] dehydratase
MNTPADALQAALDRLPHGCEFRFIDRLIELEPGKRGVGEYRVRGDEPFLRGHFPGDPMMPGVLLVEAAAQLAGVVAQTDTGIPPLPGLKLTAVRGAKIVGTARPGERIRVEARLTGRLGNLIQACAEVSTAGQTLLTVDITLAGAVITA